MLDPASLPLLEGRIRDRTNDDSHLLVELREEVASLHGAVRRIAPRSVTSVSLVATHDGNYHLHFDPFYQQIIRIVDSYGKEEFLDAITPTADTTKLSREHIDATGSPRTALGRLMADLEVRELHELSPMIPGPDDEELPSPSWVKTYRDLCEWAVLYDRLRNGNFASDTLLVRDGPLRSKIFTEKLFIKLRALMEDSVDSIYSKTRRRVFLVGFAKYTQVLNRYRLAMTLEGILQDRFPAYLEVPSELVKKSLRWEEYAREQGEAGPKGEARKFGAGKMFFVKFGNRPHDEIWSVDVADFQAHDASTIFAYLLGDAIDGFPVASYPQCLQSARRHARLEAFDMSLLQGHVMNAVRANLPKEKEAALDTFLFRRGSAGG